MVLYQLHHLWCGMRKDLSESLSVNSLRREFVVCFEASIGLLVRTILRINTYK